MNEEMLLEGIGKLIHAFPSFAIAFMIAAPCVIVVIALDLQVRKRRIDK